MSWRNRNMFTQMPQGITSGLAPVPRYKMGGMVQYYDEGGKTYPNEGLKALAKVAPEVVERMGYEEGGKTYPNEGLKALAKVAPEVVERMGYEKGGEIFPADEAFNFVAGTGPMGVPMPSGMPPQVFEEGDDEINMALNNMLQTTKPTGEAPMVLAPEEGDVIPEKEEGQSKAKEALLKVIDKRRQSLQSQIMSLINDIDLDENANSSDKFIQDVLPQIVDLAKRFEQQSKEMATKMSVSLDEEEVTLLTNEFEDQLENKFPATAFVLDEVQDTDVAEIPRMKEGGIFQRILDFASAGNPAGIDLNDLIKILGLGSKTGAAAASLFSGEAEASPETPPIDPKQLTPASLLNNINDLSQDTPSFVDPLFRTNITDKATPYYEELKDRAEVIRNAGLASGKSKQGGLAGLFDVKGQADIAAEKTASAGDVAMIQATGRGSIAGSAAERDYLRGSPIARQTAFGQLLSKEGVEKAYEQFLENNLEIPAAFDPDGIFNSSKIINGVPFSFYEHYRKQMALPRKEKPGSLSEIIGEWNKITGDTG